MNSNESSNNLGTRTNLLKIVGRPVFRRYFLALIIAINVFFFVKANLLPIEWEQGEITYQHFFWMQESADPAEPTLKSGLHFTDLKKLLYSEAYDYHFRNRHLGYLCSMLAFKFWNGVKCVTFRDYNLVVLHLCNVVLLFFLIKVTTKNSVSAIMGSLAALNSGVALASLNFPFMPHKMLLVLLFLLAWLIMAGSLDRSSGSFFQANTALAVLFFLCMFTDEMCVFLALILIIFLMCHHSLSSKIVRNLMKKVILAGSLFLLFRSFLFHPDALLGEGVVQSPVIPFLKALPEMLASWQTYRDVFWAIGGFFVPKNFGIWEMSFPSLLSAFCLAGICAVLITGRHTAVQKTLAISIILSIFLKALLLPHLWGVHEYIMPPSATFACLYFVTCYYTYPDIILLAVLAGFLLSKPRFREGGLLCVILITIINASNLLHIEHGIRAPLAYHGAYQTHRHAIPKILKIKQILSNPNKRPVYLSFPSGSRPHFQRKAAGHSIWQDDPQGERWELSPYFINYASLIPVRFLSWIEEGTLVISLKNIKRPQAVPEGEELQLANFFYDVPQEQLLNLANLKALKGTKPWESVEIRSPKEKTYSLPGLAPGSSIVCFVKGAASLSMESRGTILQARQRYGYSYQMFSFPLPKNTPPASASLTIRLTNHNPSVSFLGPFVLSEDNF